MFSDEDFLPCVATDRADPQISNDNQTEFNSPDIPHPTENTSIIPTSPIAGPSTERISFSQNSTVVKDRMRTKKRRYAAEKCITAKKNKNQLHQFL